VKAIVQLAWAQVGLVQLHTVGSKVRSLGQWAAANCTTPPSVFAAVRHFNCKPLLVMVSL